MCEDYNSPQSVYWCMKSFCCLGLPASHPFWAAKEQDYPKDSLTLSHVAKAPMQIVCNSGSHHFLLSAGQFCPWPLKATEAKYGKFAYSSHFGFSVPTGPLIQQMAPDSTLALRLRHDECWRVRWVPQGAKFSTATLRTAKGEQQIPALVASWRPWKLHDVEVYTALIATTSRWPEWHIRIHKIIVKAKDIPLELEAIDGGFAIDGRTLSDGLPVQQQSAQDIEHIASIPCAPEFSITCDDSSFVVSAQGMSGIREIRPHLNSSEVALCQSEGYLLKPDSNTNLMCPRTVIPTIKSTLPCNGRNRNKIFYLATGIFATEAFQAQYLSSWADFPSLDVTGKANVADKDYVRFTEW